MHLFKIFSLTKCKKGYLFFYLFYLFDLENDNSFLYNS